MSYIPKLNQKYSSILRRIAWGLDKPMTKTLSIIIDDSLKKYNKNEICKKCKDKTYCNDCVFNPKKRRKKR